MRIKVSVWCFILSFFGCCGDSSNVASDIKEKRGELQKANTFLDRFQGDYPAAHLTTILTFLSEIKDILTHSKEDNATSVVNEKIESLSLYSKNEIENLDDRFQDLSTNTNQKVSLMLENFSTLKLLVIEQQNEIDKLRKFISRDNHDLKMSSSDADIWKIPSSEQSPINSHLLKHTLHAIVPDSPEVLSLAQLSTEKIPYASALTSNSKNPLRTLTHAVDDIKSEIAIIKHDFSSRINDLSHSQRYVQQNVSDDCNCPDIPDMRESIAVFKIRLNTLDQLNLNIEKEQEMRQNELDEIKMDQQLEKHQMNRLVAEFTSVKNYFESLTSEVAILRREKNGFEKALTNILNQMKNKEMTQNAEEDKPALCVSPFLRRANGCFFVVKDKRLNWEESRQHCQKLQGDLAAPKHFEEFKEFLKEMKLSRSYNYWVGGTDTTLEGSWAWVDGSSIDMGPTVWSTGSPRRDEASNCMELTPGKKFVASDAPCHSRRNFICEQMR